MTTITPLQSELQKLATRIQSLEKLAEERKNWQVPGVTTSDNDLPNRLDDLKDMSSGNYDKPDTSTDMPTNTTPQEHKGYDRKYALNTAYTLMRENGETYTVARTKDSRTWFTSSPHHQLREVRTIQNTKLSKDEFQAIIDDKPSWTGKLQFMYRVLPRTNMNDKPDIEATAII